MQGPTESRQGEWAPWINIIIIIVIIIIVIIIIIIIIIIVVVVVVVVIITYPLDHKEQTYSNWNPYLCMDMMSTDFGICNANEFVHL